MSQCEDRISGIEDTIVVNNHEKKDFLNIVKDHEKSTQQLLDDAKNNIRLIGVNEKAGDGANDIKNLFRYHGRKFPWQG